MKQNWLLSIIIVFSSPALLAESPTPTPLETQQPPAVSMQQAAATDEDAQKNDDKSAASKTDAAQKSNDKDNKDATSTQSTPSLSRRATPPTPKYLQKDPEVIELEKNKQLLILKNSMEDEQLREKNKALLSKLQQLRWEKELLSEELELERLKKEAADKAMIDEHEDMLAELTRDSELAAAREAKLASELATQRTQWELKNNKLQQELDAIRLKDQRDIYTNKSPVYLENPLTEDNTLVISDRRIDLDGPIMHSTAEYITRRLNYYNNKDEKMPIFLVIESSPGGSAMAGAEIMKAMESSKAPVYVVVKSFAASMAAIITTLAEHSYAYPNAIIMHHQPIATIFLASLNLTEQKEFYEDSKEWWDLMMEPVAKKMGMTGDELIEAMYENASNGNWDEFATKAHELKWVNNIVDRIHETNELVNPDAETENANPNGAAMPIEVLTKEGRTVMYLPRLTPKDPYFIYNPDNYYQVR